MTLEMGLWRTDGKSLKRVESSGIAFESQLEDYIEADPMLLGERLMLIGRQVRTEHGGVIDLLAVDADGAVHVLELKRDKTPRDVVAQVLDYGSWVANLDRSSVIDIFEEFRPGESFDANFVEAFGGEAPDELNASQVFTVVGASLDPATERIVRFLNEDFGVPLNVVFFRHFDDGGASYLARTWLVSAEAESAAKATPRKSRTRETWNGKDWYASFGESPDGRNWADARKYGFVSAGGGEWYSRSLKNLPVGGRLFVCIPKRGYVGVGTVKGEARPFDEAVGFVDGVETPLKSLNLAGNYAHEGDGDEDSAEYVVPVEWTQTVGAGDAIWKIGMFANQNSACKLRHEFTIETVTNALGVND